MNKRIIFSAFLSFIFFLFVGSSIFAHPGRTDSSGCHTCKTNCEKWGLSYGEYHCHRSQTIPTAKPTRIPTKVVIQKKTTKTIKKVTPMQVKKTVKKTTKATKKNPTATPKKTYTCNCRKTCSQLTCAEAYFQLNNCGCSARDGDNDGVPCEAQCR